MDEEQCVFVDARTGFVRAESKSHRNGINARKPAYGWTGRHRKQQMSEEEEGKNKGEVERQRVAGPSLRPALPLC